MRIVALFLTILLLISCATNNVLGLRKVSVGMDKSDVLELAGSPTRIQRILNQDRWTYENRSNNSLDLSTTYVFFAEGRVTHIDNR